MLVFGPGLRTERLSQGGDDACFGRDIDGRERIVEDEKPWQTRRAAHIWNR